jgi:hypothetical protein
VSPHWERLIRLITETSVESGEVDFCIWKGCSSRCDSRDIPIGWSVFTFLRNTGTDRGWKLHGALCPKHMDELLRYLQKLKPSGQFTVRMG